MFQFAADDLSTDSFNLFAKMSLITNFWIFPVTVVGKESTNSIYLGILKCDSWNKTYFIPNNFKTLNAYLPFTKLLDIPLHQAVPLIQLYPNCQLLSHSVIRNTKCPALETPLRHCIQHMDANAALDFLITLHTKTLLIKEYYGSFKQQIFNNSWGRKSWLVTTYSLPIIIYRGKLVNYWSAYPRAGSSAWATYQ